MRKSLWSPDEDEKLRRYVATHGCGNWSDVAKHTGLHRCGKSCRLRWINYLRPDLKRGPFSAHEVRLVVNLHNSMGNSWSKIATQLPGRTDNDVKNFWHSYTRSRRIQQQQHASKAHQNSDIITRKGSDQLASAVHDQYHSGDIHKRGTSEQGHIIKKNSKYEDLVQQLQPLSQPACTIKGLTSHGRNVNNLPEAHLSACEPTDSYAAILSVLAPTHMSSIGFDQPSQIVAHNNQAGSHAQEPSTTHTHNMNLDSTKLPFSLPTCLQPPGSEDSSISAFYKLGFTPQNFNDKFCTKVSSMSFENFPSLKEASHHSNILHALSSSHVSKINSTEKSKSAAYTSSPSTNSLSISHEKPHHSHALIAEYPAASFDPARSLPAAYAADIKHVEAADLKPPEGLQSVIWSFCQGQPEAFTSADASDDYNNDPFISANHEHYLHNHIINPQLAASNYFLSDHHSNHQQVSSDQCTNAETLSFTSSSNLPCLQAQYLADCFS